MPYVRTLARCPSLALKIALPESPPTTGPLSIRKELTASTSASRGRRMTLSAPAIRGRKRRNGAIPLVMVTAYDEPGARLASAAGVDLILVGDSMANVVLGQETTLHISIDEMCHHVRAVAAAKPDAHVVADMPWLSYHIDLGESVRNAAKLIRSGADSVKLEGGRVRQGVVRALLDRKS